MMEEDNKSRIIWFWVYAYRNTLKKTQGFIVSFTIDIKTRKVTNINVDKSQKHEFEPRINEKGKGPK